MTKDELITKIDNIMSEAHNVDRAREIIEDMRKTAQKEFTEAALEAVTIGYAELLYREIEKARFIWLHLYELKTEVGKIPSEGEASKEVCKDD